MRYALVPAGQVWKAKYESVVQVMCVRRKIRQVAALVEANVKSHAVAVADPFKKKELGQAIAERNSEILSEIQAVQASLEAMGQETAV